MKGQAATQEGMFGWDYIVRLNQTSMKGLEGKVSGHLGLFKAVKASSIYLWLTLAHPPPYLTYRGGSPLLFQPIGHASRNCAEMDFSGTLRH